MIQFKRKLYGLDKLYYDYVDNDPRSRNIFRLLELPETFNLGRNQFKLLANNEYLLKNSKIYIDIVDANGAAIYYEISPIANKDNSRSVIVYIYNDTPPGNCTIRIAGRLFKDPSTKEDIFFNDNIRDEPNVLWTHVANVSPYQESESRIKFLTDPVIRYKERIEQLQVISGSTRLTENRAFPGRDTISMYSVLEPKQVTPSDLDIERTDVQKKFTLQSRITSGVGASETSNISYFTGLSTIRSTNFLFSSSMEGGMIYVNGINIPYPTEAVVTSSFLNLSYSASIVSVINDNLVEVTPAFQRSLTYKVVDGSSRLFSAKSFTNHGNFTASFYDVYDLSSSLTTQSFLEIDAYGIQPISGKVEYINVSYKSINSFGDFENIGDFEVNNNNLLTDSASLKFSTRDGVTELPIGYFPEGTASFEANWMTGSVGTLEINVYDNADLPIKISDGIAVKQGAGSQDKYTYLRPKSAHSIYVTGGSEMELSFASFLEYTPGNNGTGQIDVYVTGSNNVLAQIVTDTLEFVPPKNPTILGTYIGSLSATNGALRNASIPFIVREAGHILPVFVIRSGLWHFGKVEVRPNKELGFSPNQTRIFVPLTDVQRESELIFRIEYKDAVGIKSEVDTKLYGLYFQGSSPIQFDEISNAPSISSGGNLQSLQAYKKYYITHSTAQTNNVVTGFSVEFPIFVDETTSAIYTGSNYNVGLTYQVDTVIFGKTGSATSPMNAYTWAGSLQGRAIVSAYNSFGVPTLYNTVALSGSNVFGLGTYGDGPVGVLSNLEDWFTFTAASVVHSNRDLRIRYAVTTTSSFYWDLSIASTCTVLKHENNVTA